MSLQKFHGYGAKSKDSPLEKIEFDAPVLKENDVTIKVQYCGLCHSDLHVMSEEWGKVKFPFIGGHEVIGEIVEVGSAVKDLKKGQRVGVGWLSGNCTYCYDCKRQNDQYCSKKEQTIINRYGGFADYIRVQSTQAYLIPDSLPSDKAGPLLCAGNTVFSPLKRLGAKPTDRIGVYGIGGLGHLAIQFARALGCHVVAFSSSDKKEEEARKFGATQYVNTSDPKSWESVRNSLDIILITGDKGEWDKIVRCLRIEGKMVFLGAGTEKLSSINVMSLIAKGVHILGSAVGGRTDMEDMLEFAARNNVLPQINLVTADKINEGLDMLKKGEARYRVVIKFD